MIRRLSLLVVSALMLVACNTGMNPFSFPPDMQSAFDEKPEARFLKRNPKLAVRNGRDLTLNFSNGATRSFEDNREEECEDKPEGEIGPCYISYRVIGYWGSRDLFLLDILFYEGSSAALVHRDGSIDYIPGRPVFSYDSSRFSAFSEDCFFDHFSLISISDFVDREIVESLFDKTGDGVGVEAIHWVNRNRLSVQLFDCRDGYETVTRWQAFLQKKRDNSWVWEGNHTQIPVRTDQ